MAVARGSATATSAWPLAATPPKLKPLLILAPSGRIPLPARVFPDAATEPIKRKPSAALTLTAGQDAAAQFVH
jgi:hypothetical protein